MPVGETDELPPTGAPGPATDADGVDDADDADAGAGSRPADQPGAAGDAGDTGATGAGGKNPWRSRFTVAVVAAGLFLVLAVVMSLVAIDRNNALTHDADEREEVTSAAGRLAEALMTYDYRHLDQFQSGVLALATGSLRNQFEDSFDTLSTTITGFKASATATVNGIFVDIGESTASAIVVVEQVVTSDSGTRPEPTFYLQLDLVRVDGDWKVDNVTNLNLAVLGNAGGQTPVDGGGSSTSTTAGGDTTTTTG